MEVLENPVPDSEQTNFDDAAERRDFFDALIARSAEKVRAQRMKAFEDGLIDEEGYVIDRSLITSVDPRLDVEQ
jgi:hypothetical protein